MKSPLFRYGLIIAIIGVFAFIFIRMATCDTDLSPEVTYQLPEFASFDNLPDTNYGQWAVVIDGHSVASARTDTIQPTASTTKMILSLAVMRAKPFNPGETGETITITPEFYDLYQWYITHNGSNSAVEAGEQISQYDALASVLLVSSNNMADTLAIWAFGSLDNYRDYASQMLQEWGITDTTIGSDASGYEPSTTSNASDLARIGAKLLEEPVLAEIVGLHEHVVPVAGTLTNGNALLGTDRIIGVKTGFIGEESGYCLVTGYREGEHIITATLLGAPDRTSSFSDSDQLVVATQSVAPLSTLVTSGQVVGYYHPWWSAEPVPITSDSDFTELGYSTPDTEVSLQIPATSTDTLPTGTLDLKFDANTYHAPVSASDFPLQPSLIQRFLHVFGWRAN